MSGKRVLLARPAKVSQKIDRGVVAHRVIGRRKAKVLCLHLWEVEIYLPQVIRIIGMQPVALTLTVHKPVRGKMMLRAERPPQL